MKRSDVYLRAARTVFGNRALGAVSGEKFRTCFSCIHLSNAQRSLGYGSYLLGDVREAYKDMFAPEPDAHGAWLDNREVDGGYVERDDWGKNKDAEQREWRVTALCFAAAMADTGDL